MKATCKAVRDHSQQAIVIDETITVVSRVGRVKTGSFSFTREDWVKTKTYPTFNEAYNQRQFMNTYWDKADYDNAPAQAERITDARVMAINEALRKEKAANDQ